MSTQQANDLIKQYTLRNIQTQKQLSSDYTGWYVSALLKTLSVNNPIRDVMIRHYRDRKLPQLISEELSAKTGIDLESSRRRVRWAETAAEDMLFSAMIDEMENEKLQIAA